MVSTDMQLSKMKHDDNFGEEICEEEASMYRSELLTQVSFLLPGFCITSVGIVSPTINQKHDAEGAPKFLSVGGHKRCVKSLICLVGLRQSW
jgi:hypothetical protein